MDKEQYKYDFFLSFSSKDIDYVKPIWEKLVKSGFKVFFSDETLKKSIGFNFDDEIETALAHSKDFILVCTPNAMKSEWVKDEYKAFYHQIHKKNRKERRLIILEGEGFNNSLVPLMMRTLHTARTVDEVIGILAGEGVEQTTNQAQEESILEKPWHYLYFNSPMLEKIKKRPLLISLFVVLIASLFIFIYLKINSTGKEPEKEVTQKTKYGGHIVGEFEDFFKAIFDKNLSKKMLPVASSRKPVYLNFLNIDSRLSWETNHYYITAYSYDSSTSYESFDTNNTHVILEMKNGKKTFVNNNELRILNLAKLSEWLPDPGVTLFRFNILIDNNKTIEPQSLAHLQHIFKRLIEFLPPVFEAQIIRFSDDIQIKTKFTRDKQELINAITQEQPQEGTALYDAIEMGVQELRYLPDDGTQRFSILITNNKGKVGLNFSAEDFKREIVNICRKNSILLFIIGVEDVVNSQFLSEIAEFGFYQHIKSFSDLALGYQVILNMIKNTYILKIPVNVNFSDLSTIYLVKKMPDGSDETIQDFNIHPRKEKKKLPKEEIKEGIAYFFSYESRKILLSMINEKLPIPPPGQNKLYITNLSFMNASTQSTMANTEMAELINGAVTKGMNEAQKTNQTLVINENGHTIPNTDANVNKLVNITFEPDLTKTEKVNKMIMDLMNPNSVDVIVTGQYVDDAKNPLISIRPLIIVNYQQKIVTKKNLQFSKEELLCENPISKKKVLCKIAFDEILQAVQELLEQL